MINTLNESSLHKTLKTLYSQNEGCRTEVESDGYIYDIADKKGNITEIQTRNLAKLLPKIQDTIALKHKIRIVYPLVTKKYIELYSSDGNRISRRKSPVNGSIYNLFDELTGIYPVLLEKKFSLEVLEITMCERRIRTEEPVQSKNGRRRFPKNWLKTNKQLEEITCTKTFKKAEDYLSLIPKTCSEEFSAKELSSALKADKTLPVSASRQAHLMLWVLKRMEIIEELYIKNRSRYYRRAQQ